MEQLVRNALRTPDGTVLESRHRHDYKTHIDSIDGLEYMVDGGLDYARRSLMGEDLCVYTYDSFELKRKSFKWGTYGINGDEPLKHVALSDMSTEHIEAILNTQILNTWVEELMEAELGYRETT